jgi:hypothetical protein
MMKLVPAGDFQGLFPTGGGDQEKRRQDKKNRARLGP